MQKQAFSLRRELFEFAEAGISALVCVVLLFTFVGRTVQVVGASMSPTLTDGDRLVITRLYTDLQCGDIVVTVKPFSRNEPLIKRVIARGGQVVDINFANGEVTVDGVPLDEPYIAERISWESEGDVVFPQTVPEGCLFLMGDNRNHSWDSRSAEVGMVDENYVLGKVLVRFLPFDQRSSFI